VLDCCCYTGGFALNAAVGGAIEVVGVDSSAPALERAAMNATLNEVGDRCRFVQADVKSYLQDTVASGAEKFDIVVRACSGHKLLSVTRRALSVTQRALSVTQRALSVIQRALSVTQRALSVTQ
jgi:ribosomal protein L11 methylase PrmA